MANKRSHVEVSQLEISLILESFAKNSNNWVAIQSDLRRNLHLLPPATRDLYQNGKYDKVKRRMSDQVRKATKEGFVPLNDEVTKYIEEIKTKNQRYQKKEHPSEKKKVEKQEVEKEPPAVDVRQAIINADIESDPDLPDLEDDDSKEENETNMDETIINEGEPEDARPEVAAGDKKTEPEKEEKNSKKRQSTTDMARETYKRYLEDSDRGRALEAKMMKCMDKFLDM